MDDILIPKMIQENYRIEVEPDFQIFHSDIGPLEKERFCEKLALDIRRHIDGYQHVGVYYDTKQICRCCLSEWNPDDEGWNGCCEHHCTAWEEAHKDLETDS